MQNRGQGQAHGHDSGEEEEEEEEDKFYYSQDVLQGPQHQKLENSNDVEYLKRVCKQNLSDPEYLQRINFSKTIEVMEAGKEHEPKN